MQDYSPSWYAPDAEGNHPPLAVIDALDPANDFTRTEQVVYQRAKNSSDVRAAQSDLIFISRLHQHISDKGLHDALLQRVRELREGRSVQEAFSQDL